MGVDATTKWKSEGFVRRWPNVIQMSPDVITRVDALWKKAGLK
jgi:4-hydroxy-3-polyprenylbenzoate decarboxylase